MNSKRLWNGLGIAAPVLAIGCAMVWFRMNREVGIPDNRALFVAVWLFAAAVGVAALVKAGWIGRVAAVPAIAVGLFLPFTISISEQILPPNAIQVGDTIPAFSAPDDRGEIFDSARLRGKPVLIKFFRAHW
jgi:cytochrome oxidase Cu insertion factor (SCO1/SenC/PrrC family)